MDCSLAALALCSQEDWLEQLSVRLEDAGLVCSKKWSFLQVWPSPGGQEQWQRQAYSDGWVVRRTWTGSGPGAVSVSPRRFYFTATGERDERQEMKIVRQRPPANHQKRLAELEEFLGRLGELAPGLLGDRLQLGAVFTDLHSECELVSGTTSVPVGAKLNEFYRSAGFDQNPADFVVSVVGAEGVPEYIAQDFSSRLKQGYEKRECPVTVKAASVSSLEKRLGELEAGDEPSRKNVPVVLILGPRSQPVPEDTLEVMRRLDQCNLPWRRAHSDDNRDYSVPDQLGSILEAAGGCSYRVKLPGEEELPWSIGVDLSHRGETTSVLCVALVDPGGRFVHAWTSTHRRNESIERKPLQRLLRAAIDEVREKDPEAKVLIVRDGRLFEKEEAESYLEALGGRTTLVELRKRGNPPLFVGSPPGPPRTPVFASVPGLKGGKHVGFMVTLPRSDQGDFDSVLKVHWEDRWNGLKLGEENMAKLLSALTYTPGLGNHPRYLPAPVYWADGIAGASDDDLRFRGRPVTLID